MRRYIMHSVVVAMLLMIGTAHAQVQTGTLKFLRVNEVGDSFGPPGDAIIPEVVVSFDNVFFYGFQLRQDGNQISHQAMADLLREAFENNWTVTIEANVPAGKHQGMIIRVVVTKP
jgi:hypothetical protein